MKNRSIELEPTAGAPAVERTKDAEVLDYQRLETVLVVEDQHDLNRALALRLQAAGLNVACAYDGLGGLDKMRDLEPDVVVLDLRLPQMNGFRMLHAVRNEWNVKSAPIIVVTGDPDPRVDEKAARWGVRRVLRKPVSPKVVVREVLDALEGY